MGILRFICIYFDKTDQLFRSKQNNSLIRKNDN